MAFVAVCGVICLTNPTDTTGSSGDDSEVEVNQNADKYPDDDIYNGANYNIIQGDYGVYGPNGASGGVGLYYICYESSTLNILYSAGGSGSDKVEYNVILSTKGASSMKILTSSDFEMEDDEVEVTPSNTSYNLARFKSTVLIDNDTRIYVQFTKWNTSGLNCVFYLGTFTPAEFNQ